MAILKTPGSESANLPRESANACERGAGEHAEHGVYSAQVNLQDFALLMRAVLEVEGLPAAVRVAQMASRHRFAGVYRFEGELLANLCTWDKLEGAMSSGSAVPIHESFCVHILQSGKAMTVIDSAQDDRLAGHPRRADFRSYCGAPLLNREGGVAGTFCYYDTEPDRLGEADFERVHIAAAVLQARALDEI